MAGICIWKPLQANHMELIGTFGYRLQGWHTDNEAFKVIGPQIVQLLQGLHRLRVQPRILVRQCVGAGLCLLRHIPGLLRRESLGLAMMHCRLSAIADFYLWAHMTCNLYAD